MNSKLSFISAIAGIVALALPAFAQTNAPAPASPAPSTAATQVAPPAAKTSGTVEHKATKKDKTVATKKHDKMVKTAKSDTGHKPAPVKPEAPASNAGK